jgi:3-carboxy-cis,cis-muconate cycloisomerase
VTGGGSAGGAGNTPVLDQFFGSDAMRAAFGEPAQLQAWLDVEAALARAQGALGLIPADAAAAIDAAAKLDRLDHAAIAGGVATTAHPIVPLVRALADAAGDDAGRWVHLGATTQDVMDTGHVLLIRQGLETIEDRLDRLAAILRRLAVAHRTTPMAGRTHGQHALPTTFGLRAAGWYEEIGRHRARLREMRPRLLVGSFGGAAGTLAGYGPRALELRTAVMRELGLGEPGASWHASPDRFAECLSLLGLIAATGEKLAREVYFLGRTEIGEAFEAQADGQVGSSTMPQKRNPIRSEAIVAAAQIVRAQVPAALAAMVAQDDRDMGAGMILWRLIPETFILAGGILDRLVEVFDGLRVDPEAMARNLRATGGRILAEAVMLRLAEEIGRPEAHRAITEAVRAADRSGDAFLDSLAAHPAIADRLSKGDLERLLDPGRYLGAAAAIVDRVAGDGDDQRGERTTRT